MEYKRFERLALLFVINSFCFAVVLAEECPADADKDWSYDLSLPNGPLHWGDKYPNCKGDSQSPVNIITSDVERSGVRQRLQLDGYDEPISRVLIMNNGHMIHVIPRDGVERSVTVDDEKYILQSIHFHWGNATDDGSEDVIDSRRHTMETHLVHKKDDKLVALAGFLEESGHSNPALDNILSVKQAYQYEGQKFEGYIRLANSDSHRQGKIYLEDLIANRCPYFRYEGSIGFPPCNEGVTWLICRKEKKVNRDQLNSLFSLYKVKKGTPNEDKCHMENIYRPVQPLNGRKVYKQ